MFPEAACLAAGAGVFAWFARRARTGARARGAAGIRLRLTGRIAAAARRVSLPRALVATLAGVVIAGVPGGVAGAIIGIGADPLARARGSRKSRRALDAQMPDVLRALAAALRAGRNLPQALESTRDDAADPVRAALDAAVSHLDVGAPLDSALDAFAREAGTPVASLAVETIRIGRAAGAELPGILDVAVESLAERERVARDRRAATVQARMSAAVVGAMPVAFFALAGSGARAQVMLLFRDPIGWMLAAVGLTFEGVGILWVRSLARDR